MKPKKQSNIVVRESITLALLQLMETKPFRDISITELAEKAGVARISFYRSYNSKEDVLAAHLNEMTEEWKAHYELTKSPDFFLSLFRHINDMRDLIGKLYASDLSNLMYDHFRHCCDLDKDLPKKQAYSNARIAGILFAWCDQWVRRGMVDTPEELNELILQDLLPNTNN